MSLRIVAVAAVVAAAAAFVTVRHACSIGFLIGIALSLLPESDCCQQHSNERLGIPDKHLVALYPSRRVRGGRCLGPLEWYSMGLVGPGLPCTLGFTKPPTTPTLCCQSTRCRIFLPHPHRIL